MSYRARPFLPACVEPLASLWMVRHHGAEMEAAAARYERQGQRAAARELRRALASLQESARQFVERAEAATSASGSPEVPNDVEGAESAVSPPRTLLTVGQVAEQLRVSGRQVTNLCRSGQLSATQEGRQWRIDAASVAVYDQARSSRA